MTRFHITCYALIAVSIGIIIGSILFPRHNAGLPADARRVILNTIPMLSSGEVAQ